MRKLGPNEGFAQSSVSGLRWKDESSWQRASNWSGHCCTAPCLPKMLAKGLQDPFFPAASCTNAECCGACWWSRETKARTQFSVVPRLHLFHHEKSGDAADYCFDAHSSGSVVDFCQRHTCHFSRKGRVSGKETALCARIASRLPVVLSLETRALGSHRKNPARRTKRGIYLSKPQVRPRSFSKTYLSGLYGRRPFVKTPCVFSTNKESGTGKCLCGCPAINRAKCANCGRSILVLHAVPQ